MATNKFGVNCYSPSDVILIIAGYQVTGWESITITRRMDSFIPVYGIRGKHTTVPSGDTSATITIPLLQTSQSNDVFSSILGLDEINGTGKLNMSLVDNSGDSVFYSDEARILGYPEVVFSGNFSYRAWRIFCQTTYTYEIGGNGKPSTNLFDSVVSGATNLVGSIF